MAVYALHIADHATFYQKTGVLKSILYEQAKRLSLNQK